MAVILILGATGLLGTTLVPVLASSGHRVIAHGFTAVSEEQADLCDYFQTSSLVARVKPECIINLVALTNVDQCERNPHKAYLLNVSTVVNVVRSIREKTKKCHLIQISTDQVYDGRGPHAESNITITNSYAFSKIASELVAAGLPSTVVRTSFFGRSRCATRMSFSDWIVRSLRHDESINVFDDIMFSPLEIKTLAAMIERLVTVRPVGLFNLGTREGMSKSDFAFSLAEVMGLPTKQITRTRSNFSSALEAYRPKDMRMDCSHFEQTIGLKLPILIDQLHLLRSDYLE